MGPITDALGSGVVFQLELKDRNYVLRAMDSNEAAKWVHKLTTIRNEALANTIPEESSSPRQDATKGTKEVGGSGAVKVSSTQARSPEMEKTEWGKSGKKESCCLIS